MGRDKSGDYQNWITGDTLVNSDPSVMKKLDKPGLSLQGSCDQENSTQRKLTMELTGSLAPHEKEMAATFAQQFTESFDQLKKYHKDTPQSDGLLLEQKAQNLIGAFVTDHDAQERIMNIARQHIGLPQRSSKAPETPSAKTSIASKQSKKLLTPV